MSRRYQDTYEERDYYARPRYEERELEVDIQRNRYAEPAAASVVSESRRTTRQPEFLREDYGRSQAGPLVVSRDRERDREDFSDVRSRRGPPAERVEKEELIIRDRDHFSNVGSRRGGPERVEREEMVIRERERRPEPRERPREVIEREELIVRRNDREPERPRRREVEETDIVIRRGEDERPRRREVEETDIVIRRGEEDTRSRVSRREPEAPEITYRIGEGERRGPAREREVEREELIVREETRSPPRRDYRERDVERDELIIRERERSMPPPRRRSLGPAIAREREEFIFRRREPSPPRDMEKEEIIIRRRERTPPREPSPEPEREPSPEPPPALPPVIRPPIVQEIITHHRHIDHGIERVRSPTPPPPPAPAPPSPPPPPVREDLEIEIRRRGIRNGKKFYEEDIIYDRENEDTPGREMDMQITRRRSESVKTRRPDDRRSSGRKLNKDMWTEVTKDLVIREAIDEMGYDYEEADNFFYVIEYLRYEDVVRLVEITEDIRRERRERIKEIQWEREETERRSVVGTPPAKYDERIYEREIIHEGRRGGRYR